MNKMIGYIIIGIIVGYFTCGILIYTFGCIREVYIEILKKNNLKINHWFNCSTPDEEYDIYWNLIKFNIFYPIFIITKKWIVAALEKHIEKLKYNQQIEDDLKNKYNEIKSSKK